MDLTTSTKLMSTDNHDQSNPHGCQDITEGKESLLHDEQRIQQSKQSQEGFGSQDTPIGKDLKDVKMVQESANKGVAPFQIEDRPQINASSASSGVAQLNGITEKSPQKAPQNDETSKRDDQSQPNSQSMIKNKEEFSAAMEDEPKPTPNDDPDHCFVCKGDGDLIPCYTCKKPYHLQCTELEIVPAKIWECKECQIISRERLIRQLKEKSRQKAAEREQKKIHEKLAKQEAREKREEEQKQRREQKEAFKVQQRQIRLEQQLQMKQKQSECTENTVDSGLNGVQKQGSDNTLNALQQLLVGAEKARQTTLKVETTRKKPPKKEHILTPAEREKLEKAKLVKEQFAIFKATYPELVERSTVRYPIPDALILKLPELHGGLMRPKPALLKVQIDSEEFENLLYIWEFCNNFQEFLDMPSFKIEELRAALSYSLDEDSRQKLAVAEETELDWNEQMEVRHLKDKGFHLINRLHTALVEAFLRDMFPEDGKTTGAAAVSSSGEKQNQMLAAVNKLITDKAKMWPEIVRLVLSFRRNEDQGAFGPSEKSMQSVLMKLSGMKQCDYITKLSYNEKVTLLTVLIDNIHDSNEFRAFLNNRVEAKSVFNKEKMEIYGEIKSLEAAQAEFVKSHTEAENAVMQEEIDKELEQLKVQLKESSRTESKKILDRIKEIEAKKHSYRKQLAYYEDQIKKKQAHISRLHEKTFSCAIKTAMLGQDASKSEYWHFKDDKSRIYIRTEEEVPIKQVKQNAVMKDEANPTDEEAQEEEITLTETKYSWFYYENEDQLEELMQSLNPKGIRERKLQESIKKIKDRLKLQKAKKVKALEQVPIEQKEEEKNPENEEPKQNQQDQPMEDAQESKAEEGNKSELEENSPKIAQDSVAPEEEPSVEITETRRVMFETDNWKQCIKSAVWFGQRIPQKRRHVGRGAAQHLKDPVTEFFEDTVTLESAIEELEAINEIYTESSTQHGREWGEPAVREAWSQSVKSLTKCSEVIPLLIQLDDAMSLPSALLKKPAQNQDGEVKLQRFRLQLFKFWPSADIKQAWRAYVEQEGSLKHENLNALHIILKILEQICQQFAVRQQEKMDKKNKQAMMQAAAHQPQNARQKQVQQNVERAHGLSLYSRYKRAAVQEGNYVKYFESSEEDYGEEEQDKEKVQEAEEEGSEEVASDGQSGDESSSEEDGGRRRGRVARGPRRGGKALVQTNLKAYAGQQKKQGKSTAQPVQQARRGRPRKRQIQEDSDEGMEVDQREEEEQSESAASQSAAAEEESGSDDQDQGSDSKEWDEYCYVCNDGGNVLCCEGCTQVAHVSCVGLRTKPKGEWYCRDCVAKQAQKKQASRAAASLASSRGAKIASSRESNLPLPRSASGRSRRGASRR